MTKLSDELASMDATDQAARVRRGEVRPVELVEAAIGRIEAANPRINAVVTKMYDRARAAAEGPLPDGPFRGVPFLLKDLTALYAGVPMTGASAFLKDFVPDHDSELVVRYKRAGLVVVGKTSTPEWGILPTSEPALFGPCRNPWDVGRATGGSSGGSAAAVAARMVPMAHGNDGGGSIRIPASCCGVFGLKPTRGRTPLGPDLGDVMGGLAIDHALTISVRDSAALLDATAGPDLGDPYWAPPPARPFLQEVGASPGRLRVAFSTAAVTGAPVHEDCVRAVRDAVDLCASLGHEVTEAAPPLPGDLLARAFVTQFTAGVASLIDGTALVTGRAPSPELFEPFTWAFYELGRRHSASQYLTSVMMLQQIARQVARFMADYDVWVTPVLCEPPLPLGSFAPTEDNPLLPLFRAGLFAAFTPLCNFTGQPAMSVPLYWTDEGLPVGTHFIGRFGDEATLFRLAAQLEAARPWAGRRP